VLRTVGFVVTDDGSGLERCGYDTTECFHARRCRAPTGAVDFYRVKASAALETNSSAADPRDDARRKLAPRAAARPIFRFKNAIHESNQLTRL